jgi:hypothetical protein
MESGFFDNTPTGARRVKGTLSFLSRSAIFQYDSSVMHIRKEIDKSRSAGLNVKKHESNIVSINAGALRIEL